MTKQNKQLLTGSILGLIIPILGIILFWLAKYADWNFFEFIRLAYNRGLLAAIISVTLVPNLGVFFYFMQQDKIKGSQGVILASILWGALIVILKAPSLF